MIPKPYDRKTLRLKPRVTPSVATIFGMLRAVTFDYEPMFEADKINNVRTDGKPDDATSSIAAVDPAEAAKAPFQRPSAEHVTRAREIGRLAK